MSKAPDFMKTVLAITALLFNVCANATIKVVVSNSGQGWSNGNNFAPTGVPQNGDEVIIPIGSTITVKGNIYTTPPSLKITILGNLDFAPSGKLSLAYTSTIQLLTGSSITSNGTSSEQILIGDVVKYNGQNDGTILGPMYANAGTAYSSNSVTSGGFAPGVLPIKLISFNAKMLENGVSINFTIQKDTNGDRYIIERQENNAWESIKEFHPLPNAPVESSFTHLDQPTGSGTKLYRLKMISIDGESTFSSIEKIEWKPKFSVEVLTDPQTQESFIKLFAGIKGKLVIYDLQGRIERIKELAPGEILLNNRKLNILPGLHFIQYQGSDNSSISCRILIR